MSGQFERSADEWGEAHRIAAELDAGRELCLAGLCRALAVLGSDVEAGLTLTKESTERAGALGFTWAQALALTVNGMFQALAGDLGAAKTKYSDALAAVAGCPHSAMEREREREREREKENKKKKKKKKKKKRETGGAGRARRGTAHPRHRAGPRCDALAPIRAGPTAETAPTCQDPSPTVAAPARPTVRPSRTP